MYIHDYTMKQYKPGQFVSIGGKRARVYRRNPAFFTCECCEEVNEHSCTCNINMNIPRECGRKLGLYYYPKFIKQCGNQDKL